jgi:hypothetical protein
MNVPVALGLILLGGSLVVVGTKRWRSALPNVSHGLVTIAPSTPSVDSRVDDSLATAEDLIVSNDPFRIANAPSSARYDAAKDGVHPIGSTPLNLVRPSFVLRAIVGGPPWQAVIDGIPGQPAGTVVRTGNAFDQLTVSAITRDSVIIKGPDTAWTLSFRTRP